MQEILRDIEEWRVFLFQCGFLLMMGMLAWMVIWAGLKRLFGR